MSIDHVSCTNVAIEAARAAAQQLESWRRRFTVREKGRADLVTEADFAAQQAAREVLLGRFSDHAFLGEEGNAGIPKLVPNSPPTWIVDPLDGTTNYVHDVPAYCVSIGLQVESQIEVGVIYDPRLDEMFAAARGSGATLNGQPIRCSSISSLNDALLATGFPADLVRQERQLRWWEFFARQTQSLRRIGSTAISLAYVACGRFDAYWGFDNKPWDVAAAAILIQEAGGTITSINGEPFDSFDPACVASNGALHAAMLKLLVEQ